MALSDSKLLIRDYENIRHILRDVYMYGCFSREDFIAKGISGRKYDNEQRRITAYLPEDFIQKRRENKKVVLYCSYDKKESYSNKLAETYRNKSFTMFDVMSYFYVLHILCLTTEATAAQILEDIPNYNEECIFTNATLRNKLDELESIGLIYSRKRDGNVYYSLSDDIWNDFSDDEMLDIYQFVTYMRNTAVLEVPYFFLQQKLKLYMKVNRNINPEEFSTIHYEYNHLFNVLDDCVVIEILSAIQLCKSMHLEVKSINGNYETDIVPIEVIHDSVYGRQFLLCIKCEEKEVSIIRIDRIIRANIMDDIISEDIEYITKMKQLSEHCWSVSGLDQALTKVIIEFYIKDNEKFVLRRLNKEKQHGFIEQISSEVYRYEIEVGDPTEMIPWIRSFGERAKVISSGDYKIEEQIKANWKKAVEKYEAFS